MTRSFKIWVFVEIGMGVAMTEASYSGVSI